MKPAKSLRVAIYGRVSTRDKGQEVENQLAQLRDFARTQGWAVVSEFIDHESAGGTKVRPEFERLFKEASKRRFDVLLFWSLDRFSREGVYETLAKLRELDSYGVVFRSYTEQYLDTCGMFKDAVLAILAVIAKQERVRISERVKAGIERRRNAGSRIGPPVKKVDLGALAKAIESELSVTEIARLLGVSRATAHRRIAELRAAQVT